MVNLIPSLTILHSSPQQQQEVNVVLTMRRLSFQIEFMMAMKINSCCLSSVLLMWTQSISRVVGHHWSYKQLGVMVLADSTVQPTEFLP
jgi:hypothetical protein